MDHDHRRSPVLVAAYRLFVVVWLGIALYLPIAFGGGDAGQRFHTLLRDAPGQQRSAMTWHPALAEAARRHAAQLAQDGNWSHCDLSGKCANQYAREAGCNHGYGGANSVESLVAGTDDPAVALRALLGSEKHADHLLGRNAFFREQRHVGVALVSVPGSRFTHYWSIMIATCRE
jgi:uncharacterized protein YkwD